MTNVLKNAAEAIEARKLAEGESYRGHIEVALQPDRDGVTITVTDNGSGLPQQGERIVEPYMTTREKGTGLGLAIVQKILGEHGGHIGFDPAPDGGTTVRMRFARDPLAEEAGARSVDAAEDKGQQAAE